MTAALLPTRDAPDDDPRLWLEEIDGEIALAWVERESAATLARYGGPIFEADRDALAAILNRSDKIPFVARRGRLLYNFWQDAAHPRGLWRTTSFESYRGDQPDWNVLLDLDALAAAEGEDWVWSGASVEATRGERAMIRLSRGGADAAVHREFDIPSLRFVEDGFVLPEAKGSVSWLDPDTLLVSSAFGGPEMATRSGYARTVRLWRRGEDPLAAKAVFEVDAGSMWAAAQVDFTTGTERVWFLDKPAFFDTIGWLGDRGGAKERIDLPVDSEWDAVGDWLVVKPRFDWTVGGRTYPADTLLGLSLAAFLSGRRDFAVLFEPAARRTLSHNFWNDGRLVLSILDNLEPRFLVLTPGETGWGQVELDTLPTTGTVGLMSLDVRVVDTNGELLAFVQDPITPPRVLHLDLADTRRAPAVLKRSPEMFRSEGLVVTQHEAISVDGERIPYTETGPAHPSGDAPVHMTAYGGFGLPVMPHYGIAIGKLWLERGGTSVTANIRGGGEFGSAWHEAGRRAGKHLAHEDFAAVAADLVRRGVTRPDRIAAEGGSNGGLLIANMLTRHPERFGALLCTIPLIDMRRYPLLLAGASWIDEYGDPDKPEDWAFVRDISAYHNVEVGRPYPPILIATTRRDDRVHPGHARKMAAKLIELGYPAHFYEPAAGGHGYGKDNQERATFIALGYRFLRSAIGWEDDAAA